MEYKTIETINKFISLCGSDNPTNEDKEYMKYFDFEIAKSIIMDFKDDAAKIAETILAYCK